MDAVAALMLERQRYEQWIAALEAKRAITPPHVFERVRADYTKRLDQVTDQLKGRTTELKETIATLTTRLAAVQSEERAKTDARFEAELRHTVGEFTPDQWDELSRTSEAEIARLGAERRAVSEEIGRLQQILSMAGTAPQLDAAKAGARSADAEQDGAGRGGVPKTPLHTQTQPRQSFDELEFLKSITDSQGEAARAGAKAAEAAKAKETAAPAPVPAESAAKRPEGTPGQQPAIGGAPPATDQKGGATRPSRNTGALGFLKESPQEHVKTLKCAECGAMNYPTEWYCERCGAELAAM
jgi:hypothetical protein